jgi:hypothetical protein
MSPAARISRWGAVYHYFSMEERKARGLYCGEPVYGQERVQTGRSASPSVVTMDGQLRRRPSAVL